MVCLLHAKHKSALPPGSFFLSWDQLTSNTVATRCHKSSASVCALLNLLKGIYVMLNFSQLIFVCVGRSPVCPHNVFHLLYFNQSSAFLWILLDWDRAQYKWKGLIFSTDAEVSIHTLNYCYTHMLPRWLFLLLLYYVGMARLLFCVSCIFMYLCILYMMYSCVLEVKGEIISKF